MFIRTERSQNINQYLLITPCTRQLCDFLFIILVTKFYYLFSRKDICIKTAFSYEKLSFSYDEILIPL